MESEGWGSGELGIGDWRARGGGVESERCGSESGTGEWRARDGGVERGMGEWNQNTIVNECR